MDSKNSTEKAVLMVASEDFKQLQANANKSRYVVSYPVVSGDDVVVHVLMLNCFVAYLRVDGPQVCFMLSSIGLSCFKVKMVLDCLVLPCPVFPGLLLYNHCFVFV